MIFKFWVFIIIFDIADPKYVVAPAIHGRNNRRDIKARVEGRLNVFFFPFIFHLFS
jgi:hypothetical protein